MLSLPSDSTDTSQLCDMIEVSALCAHDGNASLGDLESALEVTNYPEMERIDDAMPDEEEPEVAPPAVREAVSRKRDSVYTELEERSKAASGGYPFTLSNTGVLQLKSAWQDYAAYTFCLCLSYRVWCGLPDNKPAQRLFEHLATTAAAGYIGGAGVRFGAPREGLPTGFTKAIAELCRLIGEGDGWSGTPPAMAKDDDVDVVAWVPFPDGLPGKLLMFGQCTTAYDWSTGNKPKSLDPVGFCENWFKTQPEPMPVKSFFVPHVVSSTTWRARIHHIRSTGLFFDRCRIALHAQKRAGELTPHRDWAARQITEFSSR